MDEVVLEHRALLVLGREDAVDGGEDAGQGTEADVERHAVEPHAHLFGAQPVALARVDEDRGLGALERIDRLLDVADRKQGPRPLDRALPGKELIDQRIDGAPLLGIGVLRLIDEDMRDPRIELVAHPVAKLRVLEEADRMLDEIVEVEQRPHALLVLVAIGDRAEHVEQRVGAFDQLGAAELRVEPEQPFGLTLREIGERGVELSRFLAHEGLGDRPRLREEGVEKAARRRIDRVHRAEFCLELLAGAGCDQVRDLRRPHQPLAGHRRFDLGTRSAAPHEREKVGFRQRPVAQHRPQLSRLPECRTDRLVELPIREQLEQRLDRIGNRGVAVEPARQHRLARLEDQRVALVLLQHLEPERHARLERKALQHALAEGVDGLDLEPARRLERMGEKRPRPAHRLGGRRGVAELGELLCEHGIVEDGPRAQDRARRASASRMPRLSCRSGRGSNPAKHPTAATASTRCVSTCVLPEPALAATQTDDVGSAARIWLRRTCSGSGSLRTRLK